MKKTLEELVGVTIMEVFELQFLWCSAEDQRNWDRMDWEEGGLAGG